MADVDNSKDRARLVGDLLKVAGQTISVAESCTGGLLGAWLTAASGSSAYFLGGVIAYDDSVKTSVLGVSPDLISEYGAVSAECALEMAHAARRLLRSDFALSITGIAGPTGERPGKPIGTTFVALAAPGEERVRHFTFDRDREGNRAEAALAAIEMLVSYYTEREDAV
ncbi:MAG TPA: CinA family protein [Chloroflexia bacterium]|nr:CinA family protein [Chloroflexia bacterium]